MDYAEFPPPAALADLVETFWTLRAADVDEHRPPETIVPDGNLELIVHLGDPFARLDADGEARVQAERLVAGQFERHLVLFPGPRVDVFGVRFRPHGAATFLACEPASLTGRIAPLDEVDPRLGALVARAVDTCRHGAPHVGARDADADADRVAAMSDVLLARRADAPPPDVLVARAVAELLAARGCLAVDELAARLEVSARHLTRRFTAVVGVGPKVLARTLRFQQVFRAFGEGTGARLAAVALDCGFSDQSHLVREFRRFAGEPPASFLQSLREVTEAFLRRGRVDDDPA